MKIRHRNSRKQSDNRWQCHTQETADLSFKDRRKRKSLLIFYFDCFSFFLIEVLVAQMVKNLPAMKETWVQSLCWEDLLEKRMATHSSILAWRIQWTEEPGRMQSMGSQRVGHEWATYTVIVCRGPAPADPGYSKERRHRRGSGNNCLIKL